LAYQLHYGPTTDFERKHRKKIPVKKLLSVGVLIFALVLLFVWPVTGDFMNRVMFPWSESAAAVFSATLEQGEGVSAAITAFCEQVLTESGVV